MPSVRSSSDAAIALSADSSCHQHVSCSISRHLNDKGFTIERVSSERALDNRRRKPEDCRYISYAPVRQALV